MAETQTSSLSGAEIRASLAENANLRSRDLAHKLGVSEAQLVAAQVGHGAVRLQADLDLLFPQLTGLGEVMALTRNESCVIEKVGIYDNYHSGKHASMVLNDAIDMRMFPSHWITAFAVEAAVDTGVRRSIQVFDAAGDAVHKIHLRATSNLAHWDNLVAELRHAEQSDTLEVAPRQPTETPKGDPAKVDILRTEWAKMTDTHQFMRLTSKLKMNRLGAYRMVGAPMARALDVAAVNEMLERLAGSGVEIMFFVGNRGCIEIHGGAFETLKPMGPWQNILDPGFNVHLRLDHIAEVWAVNKPTQRGDAISVETFDKDGGLIFQIFGRKTEANDSRGAWKDLVADLPALRTEQEMA